MDQTLKVQRLFLVTAAMTRILVFAKSGHEAQKELRVRQGHGRPAIVIDARHVRILVILVLRLIVLSQNDKVNQGR